MNRKIRYGNSIIQYSIIKSKRRKTSQITVDENQVIVRAPKSKSLKEIQNIMQDKAQWVFRKQLEFQKIKPSIRKISYTGGTTLPYLGKNCLLEIKKAQKKNSIKYKAGKFLVLIKGNKASKKLVKKLYEDWLKIKAEKVFQTKIIKFSKKTQLVPKKILIKNLKNRWGSATNKGVVNLNSHLLKAPNDIIDYIIIHELCHLKIKNHSFRYWNLVRKFVPNFEEKKAWLEKNTKAII